MVHALPVAERDEVIAVISDAIKKRTPAHCGFLTYIGNCTDRKSICLVPTTGHGYCSGDVSNYIGALRLCNSDDIRQVANDIIANRSRS